VGNGSLARELALTGRQFGAATAKEIGFVSDVVPGSRKEVIGESSAPWVEPPFLTRLSARAVKLGAEIASNSPIAVVATKHIMNYSRDHSVQDGLVSTPTSSFGSVADTLQNYMQAYNMSMLQSNVSRPNPGLQPSRLPCRMLTLYRTLLRRSRASVRRSRLSLSPLTPPRPSSKDGRVCRARLGEVGSWYYLGEMYWRSI
jgi:hypothetical protein